MERLPKMTQAQLHFDKKSQIYKEHLLYRHMHLCVHMQTQTSLSE